MSCSKHPPEASSSAGPRSAIPAPAAGGQQEGALVEWLLLARRYKVLLLSAVLLTTAAATAIALLKRPAYLSQASIEVGRIYTGHAPFGDREIDLEVASMLEDAGVLELRLRDRYGLGREPGDKASRLLVVEQDRQVEQVLVFKAVGSTPESARQQLQQVLAWIMVDHQQRYEGLRRAQEKHLAGLRTHIDLIRKQLEQTGPPIGGGRDRTETMMALLVQGQLRIALSDALARENQLTLGLSDSFSYPTRVIQEPDLPAAAAGPGLPFFIVSGLVLGLGLGVVGIMAGEFFGRRPGTRTVRDL